MLESPRIKRSLRTLAMTALAGLLLAIGLNMVTVRGEVAGPEGVFHIKGFPMESGSYIEDPTNKNNFVFNSYEAVLGNALVAFFTVFGVLGNFYFFREMRKK